jgi:large subunit ribosomal protein L10e
MARLRKFVCYRRVKRANTRKSKYRSKSFVRGGPVCRVVKFNVGNLKKQDFTHRIDLASKITTQVRDNALESARLAANRTMEKTIGKNNFRLQVRVYPHHILREHSLASGAGADRFSSGMAHAFGKPAGNAAQLKKDQKVLSIYCNEAHLDVARNAFRKSNHKLPFKSIVSVTKV